MKRIYLASASKGSNKFVSVLADLLSLEYILFSPCLGFSGIETPEIRKKIMEACFYLVEYWAEVVVIVYDGTESVGIWEEMRLAELNNIPVCVYAPFAKPPRVGSVPVFYNFLSVTRWLDE